MFLITLQRIAMILRKTILLERGHRRLTWHDIMKNLKNEIEYGSVTCLHQRIKCREKDQDPFGTWSDD